MSLDQIIGHPSIFWLVVVSLGDIAALLECFCISFEERQSCRDRFNLERKFSVRLFNNQGKTWSEKVAILLVHEIPKRTA